VTRDLTAPACQGKWFVVTGANTGIGKVVARKLAERGASVTIACRSREKGRAAVDEITAATNGNVDLVPLDLADLDSVRTCAAELLARDTPLYGLVNNAGLVTRGTSKQGFELIFGVNHLGHFLLTNQLLPRITQAPHSLIINVASSSHFQAKRIDWDALHRSTKTLVGLREYEVSKLANVLFTQELAKKLAGTTTTTYAVCPGTVASEVWRRIPQPFRYLFERRMRTVEQGADSVLSPMELPDHNGKFYKKDGVARAPNRLVTPALASEMWLRSEAWTAPAA
jgi:retinol dehydrogenase 12